MSGFGARFRDAGFTVPKPLIEVDGKPIIAHVIDLFPGEKDVIFICNIDHLNHSAYEMRSILERYCPSGRIVGISAHTLGPVHAVQQVAHLIDPTQPVVVNYCDFTCYWDWPHFKRFVAETACSGAIPAYSGFHPHTLGNTHYAYLQASNGWVSGIQEKQPYTRNRMQEYASSGTYYFASGQLMMDAFRVVVDQDLRVGGEFYVSLAFRPLLADNRPIAVYPLQHFMQWGTPADLAEYQGWSNAFRRLIGADAPSTTSTGALVVPMAGLGQRFVDEGYRLTKPLIPVSGKPMVAQATHDLPQAAAHAFVLRSDMAGHEALADALRSLYPQAVVKAIPAVTAGQACTALIGLDALAGRSGDVEGPVTFGACDNGALYDSRAFQRLVDDPEVDVIVWGVRGHANAVRQPRMFGWIEEESGRIRSVSVKTPLQAPATDPIVLGTFTFKRARDYRRVLTALIAREGRINGEFYIDACINDAVALGLRCRLFEVDHLLSWGTPNDLRTFNYWQSCFHKWKTHPYRLEDDSRVASSAIDALARAYAPWVPALPVPHA